MDTLTSEQKIITKLLALTSELFLKNEMHRSGFEPELLAWKAKVIATRPSVQVGCR